MRVRPGFLAVALLLAGLGLWWAFMVGRERPGVFPVPPPPRADFIPPAREQEQLGVPPQVRLREDALARVDGWMARLGGPGARPGEALLQFNSPAALRAFLDRINASSGLRVTGRIDSLGVLRLAYDDEAALRRTLLESAETLADAGANLIMQIPEPPAPSERSSRELIPLGARLLAFLGVGSEAAGWGRGVTIAVLDTGVAPDSTFGNGRLRRFDVGLGLGPGSAADDGHGTAVAALAAGAATDAQGTAPAAEVLSIRVTDATGTSDVFTVAEAIVAAVNHGAKIINLSLGTWQSSSVLSAAIDFATGQGAVLVAAAGNSQASQLEWPAADPRVVSVGAVDALGQQATFSNSGDQLHLAAPGYGVQTAWLGGQRVLLDGTSAAAPIVAGAIAALVSQNPGLSAPEAARVLEQFASEAGPAGPDPDYGRGIVNLGWAMARHDTTRLDTAVASLTYDGSSGTLGVVVQNRSARAVSGLRVLVEVDGARAESAVPILPAASVQTVGFSLGPRPGGGQSVIRTELLNPIGTNDAVPGNNVRSSVLVLPGPTP